MVKLQTLQTLAIEFKKRGLQIKHSDFRNENFIECSSKEEATKIIGLSVLLNVPFQEKNLPYNRSYKRFIFAVEDTTLEFKKNLLNFWPTADFHDICPLTFSITDSSFEEFSKIQLNGLIKTIEKIEFFCKENGYIVEGKFKNKKLLFKTILGDYND